MGGSQKYNVSIMQGKRIPHELNLDFKIKHTWFLNTFHLQIGVNHRMISILSQYAIHSTLLLPFFYTGHIPLRQLVYRVLELPQSMCPLVYDFGQLNQEAERDYIRQITINHVST